MLRGVGLLAIGALGLAMTACQTDSVSLEEAKKVTTKMSGATFVAPPRTINDITAVLEQEKRSNPQALERARAQAKQSPPPGASHDALSRFYWERGHAAGRIGDFKQQIADYREAERLTRDDVGEMRSDILWDLGSAVGRSGDYRESLRFREQALAVSPPQAYGSYIGKSGVLAVALANAGDMEGADAWLAKSDMKLKEARAGGGRGSPPIDQWAALLHRSQAAVLDIRGRHKEAEALHRSALKALSDRLEKGGFANKHLASNVDQTRSNLAVNLMRQGRVVEAEVEARGAMTASLQRNGKYAPETAYYIRQLGMVVAEQGRYPEAEKLHRTAIDILQQTGGDPLSGPFISTRQLLAETLLNQGRAAAAMAEYDALEKMLAAEPGRFDRQFGGDMSRALALSMTGRAQEASVAARTAYDRARERVGTKHGRTAMAQGIFAMTETKLGRQKEALANFREALPGIISRSRGGDDDSVTDSLRMQRNGLILKAYIGLLADIHRTPLEAEAGINAAGEAFRVADIVRGQSVQKALSAASARAAAKEPDLADMVRREQDAQKQIAAMYTVLADVLAMPTDQRPAGKVEALRTQIDQLRAARTAMAEEIEKKFPVYAQLINPKPTTIPEARAQLRPEEAVFVTLLTDERSFVWLVPQSGPVEFAVAPIKREEVGDAVGLLWGALEPNAATLADIPDFDLDTAFRLYEALLKPVERGLPKVKSLFVVADGPLGHLPLALLPTRSVKLAAAREPAFSNYRDVPWLARTHAITNLPSVAALHQLRAIGAAPTGPRRAFVGFGDPLFNPDQGTETAETKTAETSMTTRGIRLRMRNAIRTRNADSVDIAALPRLPDTAEEMKGIALALKADPTKDVFVGRQATETQVKTMDLSNVSVIAFATHGLIPGDLNGLTQPALALTAPGVSGDVDGDGLLTMEEILGLRLNADWVVLSACNTAAAAGSGAEAVSGLGRAFFYAGARALLASNWPVHSEATADLTRNLFSRQADNKQLTRAEALRATQAWMIDEAGYKDKGGRMIFSYAHPIFWAPFSLIGDGGANLAPGS